MVQVAEKLEDSEDQCFRETSLRRLGYLEDTRRRSIRPTSQVLVGRLLKLQGTKDRIFKTHVKKDR